jgi:hypothetical protein
MFVTRLFDRVRDAFDDFSDARRRVVIVGSSALAAFLVVLLVAGGATVAGVGPFARGPLVADTASLGAETDESTRSTPWAPLGPSGDAQYRWEGAQFRLAWQGACDTGAVTAEAGPQNWGYFSEPIGGNTELGATVGGVFCEDSPSRIETAPVNSWKCFGFGELWVLLEGDTREAGFYAIEIPDWIESRFCPAGSQWNDPGALWWESYEQGLVPGFEGRINYGPSGIPTPIETETPSPSPSPTVTRSTYAAPTSPSTSPAPSPTYTYKISFPAAPAPEPTPTTDPPPVEETPPPE